MHDKILHVRHRSLNSTPLERGDRALLTLSLPGCQPKTIPRDSRPDLTPNPLSASGEGEPHNIGFTVRGLTPGPLSMGCREGEPD